MVFWGVNLMGDWYQPTYDEKRRDNIFKVYEQLAFIGIMTQGKGIHVGEHIVADEVAIAKQALSSYIDLESRHAFNDKAKKKYAQIKRLGGYHELI